LTTHPEVVDHKLRGKKKRKSTLDANAVPVAQWRTSHSAAYVHYI